MQLFAVLLLCLAYEQGTASQSKGWTAPDYCHDMDCPEFKLISQNEDFEERAYAASQWVTAKVSSSSQLQLASGFSRLNSYFTGANKAGARISKDTWPALITISEATDGSEANVSVSWFVAPHTVLPEPTDSSISVDSRPPATIYVRVFAGGISTYVAQTHLKQLYTALNRAGKPFTSISYTGAGYENPLDFIHPHHNEVWVHAA